MTPRTFPVHGTATFDDATGALDLHLTPDGGGPEPPNPIPPAHGADMLDLSQAVITRESPDVRGWPIGAALTALGLSASDNASIEFTKRNGANAWPFVLGKEGGEIQYTLWVGCLINGPHFAGSILCISRAPNDNYVPTGPTLQPGQLPNNWYYFCGDPLAHYQPVPGEAVAWFLTSGDQRRTDIHAIAERTNVVIAPFSPGLFTFPAA